MFEILKIILILENLQMFFHYFVFTQVQYIPIQFSNFKETKTQSPLVSTSK